MVVITTIMNTLCTGLMNCNNNNYNTIYRKKTLFFRRNNLII